MLRSQPDLSLRHGRLLGALAFADEEALPWPVIKGHYLRHLRWWAQRPIADRDGILSVGYGYANWRVGEDYISAGSPYWALKAFLPLALPQTHPFWACEEGPAPAPFDEPVALRHPGMVIMIGRGNTTALVSGQESAWVNYGAEKYAKFAYSTRYGFTIDWDPRGFNSGAFDSALALSDDGVHYRVREHNDEAVIAGTLLYARWHPWPDVTIETWLLPSPPWHLRIHRVVTPRSLQTIEGGFAIDETRCWRRFGDDEPDACLLVTEVDVSGVRDLGILRRKGASLRVRPNLNVIHPRAIALSFAEPWASARASLQRRSSPRPRRQCLASVARATLGALPRGLAAIRGRGRDTRRRHAVAAAPIGRRLDTIET